MAVGFLEELEAGQLTLHGKIAIIHDKIFSDTVLIEREAHLITRQFLARTITDAGIEETDRDRPGWQFRKLCHRRNVGGQLRRPGLPLFSDESDRLERL